MVCSLYGVNPCGLGPSIASLPRRRGFTILRVHGCFPSLNMKLSGGARSHRVDVSRDVWEIQLNPGMVYFGL